jgi:two-component system sensor histidine kinase KdpD
MRSSLADIGSERHSDAISAAAARALGVQECRIVYEPDVPGAALTTRLTPSAVSIRLVTGGRVLGLLEIGPPLTGEEPRWRRPGFAAAVGTLVAFAVERSRLVRRALENESLRRSDELKTALLRTVSHEFRTPLTAVRTAGAALAEHRGASDDGALVGVILSETSRLERLVANLLDLSRLEAGALAPRLDWCEPVELAEGAIQAAEPLLDGLSVRVAMDEGLPLVRADAILCERILTNLLHNAVRHGAPPVGLEARSVAGRLEMAVTDAGQGPHPDVRSQMFGAFVSGPRSGGTGVGLALARGLAEAQGGTLRYEPADSGSRFVLSLGLVPVPEVLEG